jgi:FkbM family methyltransferase
MKASNSKSLIGRLRSFPGRISKEKKPCRFLIAKFLVKTGICRHLIIHRDGYRLCFHPSALSSTLWIGVHDRIKDERVLESILKPGDNFVDIGANIGSLTLKAASLIGPAGSVVGIEAHPRTFRFLKHNVGINPFQNITLHNCALGEQAGTLHFADQSADDQNCIVGDSAGNSIPVKVRALDDLELGDINLLKIDVEGYEKFVYRGASRTLKRTQAIYFECWDRHCKRYGYLPQEVLGLLKSLGFKLFLTDGENRVEIDEEYECLNCANILALRPEKAGPPTEGSS